MRGNRLLSSRLGFIGKSSRSRFSISFQENTTYFVPLFVDIFCIQMYSEYIRIEV